MAIHYYVGIDISKESLDLTLLLDHEVVEQTKIKNDVMSITWLLNQWKGDYRMNRGNAIFCMEQMGHYNCYLEKVLLKRKARIWQESALQIFRTLGIQRGKDDKVDAYRIARYAFLHHSSFTPWTPFREVVLRLKYLSRLRSRLINCKLRLKVPIGEQEHFASAGIKKVISKLCKDSRKSLENDILAVEKEMLQVVHEDNTLARLYQVISSVKGIGKTITIELLIVTNEFKKIATASKFACYAGIALFPKLQGQVLWEKVKCLTLQIKESNP